MAICRYFEEIQPEPRLMGKDAKEKALIVMWNQRIELDGYAAAMEALRNSSPKMQNRALPGSRNYEQIPALVERGKKRLVDFFEDLDARLADNPFVAGEHFSVADITAIVTIDFANSMIKVAVPDSFVSIKSWHRKVSDRAAAKA